MRKNHPAWPPRVSLIPEKYRVYTILLAIVYQSPFQIKECKNPAYEVYLSAVSRNGFLLNQVPEKFKTNKMFEVAVRNTGLSLSCIPKEKRTTYLCYIATANDPRAKKFVP